METTVRFRPWCDTGAQCTDGKGEVAPRREARAGNTPRYARCKSSPTYRFHAWGNRHGWRWLSTRSALEIYPMGCNLSWMFTRLCPIGFFLYSQKISGILCALFVGVPVGVP